MLGLVAALAGVFTDEPATDEQPGEGQHRRSHESQEIRRLDLERQERNDDSEGHASEHCDAETEPTGGEECRGDEEDSRRCAVGIPRARTVDLRSEDSAAQQAHQETATHQGSHSLQLEEGKSKSQAEFCLFDRSRAALERRYQETFIPPSSPKRSRVTYAASTLRRSSENDHFLA